MKLADCAYVARGHDRQAIAHLLATPMGGLLEDPGCGKTGQVLASYCVLKKKGLVDKLLVVSPVGPAYGAWPDEIARWGFPLVYGILHGPRRDKVLALRDELDLFTTNYESLSWLSHNIKSLIKPKERWWLVLDESTKVKYTRTQRFKTLKPLLPMFTRRTILTGTPAPQGLEDLFGQVYCADLGERLGKYITQYRREYFYPGGYGGYSWFLQDGAEERIYDALGDAFLRIDDKVLDLPPIHDVPLMVNLPAKARQVYQTLEEDFVAQVRGGELLAVNGGALSAKLRQVCNGRAYNDSGATEELHDEKVTATKDLTEQLQGNPLLVGYEFTCDGERLADELKAPLVNGGTTQKKRRALYAEFNAGKLPALVCQNETVALGENLQGACHTMLLFGLTWKLETYIQFKKRLHRSGQKKPVTVHHCIARGTIEDQVQWPVLIKKDARQSALFKALKERYA